MHIRLLFVFLLAAQVLPAQVDLDSVTVTASRIPLAIEETGRNITVLSGAEITALPATSLDEVLQSVAGLEVQSRGGFGVQGDILMRGSTFTQVLVLIDGMKMNDPLTGHFNAYIGVTPAEIARIEVLRGPAAAMYGADAVGGVINIITKTFSPEEYETSFQSAFDLGSHDYRGGYAGYQREGRLRVGGSLALRQSDGESVPERRIDSTTNLESYDTYFDLKTASLSLAYALDEQWTIRARTAYDYRDFDARYFYTTSVFDKSTEEATKWWNHLRLEQQTANSSLDVNAAYRRGTDEFTFSPDFASTNNHTTQYLNLTANYRRHLSDAFSLQTGLQADRRSIESNDRGDHNDWHYGLYATGVLRQRQLNLTLGLRGDYDDNYGFELTPQLNVSYLLPRAVLRAAVGRSIRAADYTERYVSNNLMNLTPGRSLGNPELAAEQAWSQEVGFDYSLADNWLLKATAFARQSTDLIDYIATNQSEIGSVSEIGSLQPGADYFFASNISEVNTQGLELQSEYRVRLPNGARLIGQLGYTYLDTQSDADQISVYVSSHAKHLITSSLVFDSDRIEGGVSLLYKSRAERQAPGIGAVLAPNYTLVNGRLGYRLIGGLGINLQVQNIFDVDYQNLLGAQMPGRWIMAGIRLHIL